MATVISEGRGGAVSASGVSSTARRGRLRRPRWHDEAVCSVCGGCGKMDFSANTRSFVANKVTLEVDQYQIKGPVNTVRHGRHSSMVNFVPYGEQYSSRSR